MLLIVIEYITVAKYLILSILFHATFCFSSTTFKKNEEFML